MKYAIKQIMKQPPLPGGEWGWIVNIASIASMVGLPQARKFRSRPLSTINPYQNHHIASYCASKGAVVKLTRQVALDYAPNEIHVNAVCPDFLATAIRSTRHEAPLPSDPPVKSLPVLHITILRHTTFLNCNSRPPYSIQYLLSPMVLWLTVYPIN